MTQRGRSKSIPRRMSLIRHADTRVCAREEVRKGLKAIGGTRAARCCRMATKPICICSCYTINHGVDGILAGCLARIPQQETTSSRSATPA